MGRFLLLPVLLTSAFIFGLISCYLLGKTNCIVAYVNEIDSNHDYLTNELFLFVRVLYLLYMLLYLPS